MKRIAIVEDDRKTVEELEEVLAAEFSDAIVEVYDSESEFLQALKSWEGQPPNIIILDVMLRWSSMPSLGLAPDASREESFHEAGLRCLKEILAKFPQAPPAVSLLTALPFYEFDGLDLGRATLRRKELDWNKVFLDVRAAFAS